ncbi:hypothetical protein [Sediminicola sp. 1XM1-17]|uniref:hypothetical protein n=1 Tax=Sediminicola sp. 1XM1-17 TaxID=3127702 RepID=UPI0030789BC3
MEIDKKILTLPLRISMCVILVGFIFKVLHWQLASTLLTLGFVSILVLYALRFWNKPQKTFLAYNKLILISFWTINGLIQMYHLPFALYTQIILVISLILWAVLEGTAYFSKENKSKTLNTSLIIWNLIMVLGSMAIISGGFFMLLEWDYALALLTLGVFLITIYVFKDVFAQERREEK